MSEKLLKTLTIIAGIICTILFFSVRIEPLYNLFMADKLKAGYWENKKYGELYYFNMIDHFKEKNLPPCNVKYRFTERFPTLDSADIIIFGDSFLDFSRMTTFPERLSNQLNTKVYYERIDLPLQSFAEKSYRNEGSKIFIYESAERYIPIRFTVPQQYFDEELKESKKSIVYNKVLNFIFNSNSEGLFTSMLFQSYVTKPVYSFISTFKFDYLGYISNSTPTYTFSNGQPWLFYSEEVNKDETSFYYPFTDDQIENYCDNIADLSQKLKTYYNMEMVFMPIPSKYTIYHTLINNDEYNNFLPRLYSSLEKRGIPVVKLLEDYKKSEEILYYGTDTHWNQKGLNIALDKTIEIIDSVKTIRNIP